MDNDAMTRAAGHAARYVLLPRGVVCEGDAILRFAGDAAARYRLERVALSAGNALSVSSVDGESVLVFATHEDRDAAAAAVSREIARES